MGHPIPHGEHWERRLLCLHGRKTQVPLLRWEEDGKFWELCPKVAPNGDEILWVCGENAQNEWSGRGREVRCPACALLWLFWRDLNVMYTLLCPGWFTVQTAYSNRRSNWPVGVTSVRNKMCRSSARLYFLSWNKMQHRKCEQINVNRRLGVWIMLQPDLAAHPDHKFSWLTGSCSRFWLPCHIYSILSSIITVFIV